MDQGVVITLGRTDAVSGQEPLAGAAYSSSVIAWPTTAARTCVGRQCSTTMQNSHHTEPWGEVDDDELRAGHVVEDGLPPGVIAKVDTGGPGRTNRSPGLPMASSLGKDLQKVVLVPTTTLPSHRDALAIVMLLQQ